MAIDEGYQAKMVPRSSSEASLLADLDIDPPEGGWQSYEAIVFLKRKLVFVTRSQLIRWQIAVMDFPGVPPESTKRASDAAPNT